MLFIILDSNLAVHRALSESPSTVGIVLFWFIVCGSLFCGIIMEEIDNFLENLKAGNFPVAVMRITAKIYDDLEIKRTNKATVNLTSLAKIKRMFDYVSENSVAVFKENIQLRVQLRESGKV